MGDGEGAGMTQQAIMQKKLEAAKAYLGNKLLTAKDSTMHYKRGPTVLVSKK